MAVMVAYNNKVSHASYKKIPVVYIIV